ncbi:MAG TPA: ASCH domain-containing protein [Verrucomicrobiota bacterium]|nr:ASCH domain-containing protein [Verrucomicrobiota bacterium]
MKAITVRQPFAGLIVAGVKDVENRTWNTRLRGRIAIHAASAKPSAGAMEFYEREVKARGWKWPKDLVELRGGIIGTVELVDVVTKSRSPWFNGKGFGFVLANPKRLKFRPATGQLKIWEA